MKDEEPKSPSVPVALSPEKIIKIDFVVLG